MGKHIELDAPICTSLYTSVLPDIHGSFSTNVHKDDDAYITKNPNASYKYNIII